MKKKIHKFLSHSKADAGLLVLRLGIGAQMAFHGWPKITGGTEKWEKIGAKMGLLGFDFGEVFWGFMASFSEFGGGILMIIGLFSRPAAMLISFTMFVACLFHWHEVYADGALSVYKKWMEASNAFELMTVAIAWYLLGSGRYSLDHRLFKKHH